jgi:ABC-2 type transport system permease protein
MNYINLLFLRMALLPALLYRRAGADMLQLKAILRTKLLMDDRRPNTFHQTRNKTGKKPISLATLGTMLMSLVMGLFFMFFLLIAKNPVTALTIYFTIFFFLLSASLISDFTSVLIDVRDTFIILPKPVSDITFLLARLLHIFIHICKIVLPMGLPALIYAAVEYGAWGFLLFLILLFFVTAFSLFFINALYLLLLRFTTPQKFQSIISYVQIIFAVGVYASYQVVPRMADRYQLDQLDLTTKKWLLAYPLYWFAAAWNTAYTGGGSGQEIIAAVLALLLPVASLYIVVKYLAPSFNNRLAMISSSTSDSKLSMKRSRPVAKRGLAERFSRFLSSSPAERAGFMIAWKLMGRHRDFKLKVYPAIGYLLVYVVMIFINSRRISLEVIREEGLQGRIILLSAVYFSSFLLTMAISQMTYSEKFKAAWVYFVSPIEKPGEVILGGIKAAMVRFFIPMALFISLLSSILIGPKVLPNVLLGITNILLIASLQSYVGFRLFPFSKQQSNNAKSGSFLKGIFVLLISGALAVVQVLLYHFTAVIIVFMLLSLLAVWVVMGSIRATPLQLIREQYREE